MLGRSGKQIVHITNWIVSLISENSFYSYSGVVEIRRHHHTLWETAQLFFSTIFYFVILSNTQLIKKIVNYDHEFQYCFLRDFLPFWCVFNSFRMTNAKLGKLNSSLFSSSCKKKLSHMYWFLSYLTAYFFSPKLWKLIHCQSVSLNQPTAIATQRECHSPKEECPCCDFSRCK